MSWPTPWSLARMVFPIGDLRLAGGKKEKGKKEGKVGPDRCPRW